MIIHIMCISCLRLDDANNNVNDEELDAVAQVLEDWDPMADEHFKEKRLLQSS